jgi:thioredoxin 1
LYYMTTVDLTAETFEKTLTDSNIMFVDWWAEWCGPCKMFGPTYEKASEQHPDIVFAKVDTEANQQLAGSAGIQSIPTLMAFKENILIFSQAGALAPAQLEDLIQAVKAVNMDEVRAEIAKQKEN